tara:strand:- start:598 stop:861 length:264 start_codon:yes stop_codon:yes gene_type:complete
MISKSNFDLAKPYLQYQLNERGECTPLSIDKWDTFAGWNNRGKRITAGSKGYRVEIIVPFDEGNKGKISLTGFSLRYKVLFSADQTY